MSRLVPVAVPALFVLIWSTGFVVARLVAPHVEPFTFLSLRFGGAALFMAGVATLAGSRWPSSGEGWKRAAVSGLLLQGGYLGCVFWAVGHGLPAAISALVAGAQPLVTACLARPVLGERVSPRRWCGVALGTLSITAGTIWQKKTAGSRDVAPDTAIQFAACVPVVGLMALATESGRVDPAPAFWIGLAWAVGGLSVGAIGLFLFMLRRGAVVGVASLLFLVPPVTALMSFALFGDTLAPIQLAGMAVAAAGLVLASRA